MSQDVLDTMIGAGRGASDPQAAEAKHQAGLKAEMEGDREAAVEAFREASRLSGDAKYSFQLAYFLDLVGEEDEAVADKEEQPKPKPKPTGEVGPAKDDKSKHMTARERAAERRRQAAERAKGLDDLVFKIELAFGNIAGIIRHRMSHIISGHSGGRQDSNRTGGIKIHCLFVSGC